MPSASPSPSSLLIADFVRTRRNSGLPESNLHLARRALLDTMAGALAARNDPASAILVDYAESLSGPGIATIWSSGRHVSAEAAALANGAIGHLLDFDDVTSPMRGHPSVVIWPAVMALAEAEDLQCGAALSAFITGLEVVAKLGRVVAIDHVAKGWHSTNTLGVLAATAACCQLLEMEREQIASALGLAVAMAAGTRANFGTMAKCFQAGQAAASALRAVALARRGFTAGTDALDGASGFTALYCDGQSFQEELAALGKPPLEVERSGLDVKRFPNCYATHRTIQAVLQMRQEHALRLQDIEQISVVTSARAQVPLIYARPKTGLQGKFSLQYAAAAAIEDGAITLASFTDEAVLRPQIQDFLSRVQTQEADGSPLPRWTDVTVALKDGRVLHNRTEILIGSAAAPLPDSELIEKFRNCCAYAGYRGNAILAAGRLLRMKDEPMRAFIGEIQPMLMATV